MIDSVQISGALPKPAGNPSPRGAEGGRLFQIQLAGALRKPQEHPSLLGAEGGSRHLQASQKINEYASFFVAQMMQSMRQTVMQSGLADGGRAEQAYQAMMDRELSQRLSASLGFDRAFAPALKRLGRRDEAPLQETSIQA